jgi:hypothetical protein
VLVLELSKKSLSKQLKNVQPAKGLKSEAAEGHQMKCEANDKAAALPSQGAKIKYNLRSLEYTFDNVYA